MCSISFIVLIAIVVSGIIAGHSIPLIVWLILLLVAFGAALFG